MLEKFYTYPDGGVGEIEFIAPLLYFVDFRFNNFRTDESKVLTLNPNTLEVETLYSTEVIVPYGLAQHNGELYISDLAVGAIYKHTSTGLQPILTGLKYPAELAVRDDLLLIHEAGFNRVRAYSLATGELTILYSQAQNQPLSALAPDWFAHYGSRARDGQFRAFAVPEVGLIPWGSARSQGAPVLARGIESIVQGPVHYLADRGNSRVLKYTAGVDRAEVFLHDDLQGPIALTIDDAMLYVADELGQFFRLSLAA